MTTEFRKSIDDVKAPTRLHGKIIKVTINEVTKVLTFDTELPDDPTPQELGYLRWYIGEFVDGLKEKMPGLIGDSTYEIKSD